MASGVTVVIPVGPYEANKKWLHECLQSIQEQTRMAHEVLIIDDQANLRFSYAYDPNEYGNLILNEDIVHAGVKVWKTPWLVGVPTAFNFGVALAKNELVVMLGSDDWLEPDAIEILLKAYEKNKHLDAWYGFTIRYSDTGELQDMPCNCAAVTKGLWKLTGGFPPESSVGACDSIFISMMIKNHPKRFVQVAKDYPLYNYRRHNESDTGTRPVSYQGVIHTVRDIYTTNWKAPTWT